MEQSESSKAVDDVQIQAMSAALGCDIDCGFDDDMGVYLANAIVDGEIVCAGRGISPHVALRNLRRAWTVTERSKGNAAP